MIGRRAATAAATADEAVHQKRVTYPYVDCGRLADLLGAVLVFVVVLMLMLVPSRQAIPVAIDECAMSVCLCV